MLALHCNLDSCDTWAQLGPMTSDWITVFEGDRMLGQWCCMWHMIMDLSKDQEPPVAVDL